MSVGSIGRGFNAVNSLLNRLSSSNVGPQGPSGGTGPRPPVENVQPLPARPDFRARYQQDAFEDGPRRQGGGRGRGGGLDLSGGGGQGPASGDASSGGGKQARANEDQAASLEPEARRQKRQPAEVIEFPRGEEPRKRQQASRQPQKASAPQQKPVPQPKPQKPVVRAPKPDPGAAFKPVVVRGEVQMERRSPGERKAESPQMAEAGAAAQMMVQLSQRM
jgi:hypothetical protein